MFTSAVPAASRTLVGGGAELWGLLPPTWRVIELSWTTAFFHFYLVIALVSRDARDLQTANFST
jgi:hypothetical protein